MTHRTQFFPNVSFLYTYIFYSFQFSDALLLFLCTQFSVYKICSIFYLFATSFSASLFLLKSHWHGFFVFLRHWYVFYFFYFIFFTKSAVYPFFSTFFLTIHKHLFLWVVCVASTAESCWTLVYSSLYVYIYTDLWFRFIISHLFLFHWQIYLIDQKMHGQINHIFALWHESALPTIWLILQRKEIFLSLFSIELESCLTDLAASPIQFHLYCKLLFCKRWKTYPVNLL